jgi:type IV pilus assembly protein PilY1
MGGQIFALKGPADGSAWTGRKIFQAGDGTSATAQLKFFYAPDVALQGYQYKQDSVDRYSVVEYVYGGTGDREHPLDITFDNRFYGIKNIGDNTVLTESSLTDVTYYSTGYSLPHDASYLKGMNSKGWFIRLGYELGEHKRPGEQVVSSPIVFDGIVYFTTYAPDLNAAAGDKCLKHNDGEGFLYAVDYLTGEAIREFNFSLTEEQKAGKVGLNETNRRYSFGQGSGMPTKPRLTMTDSGPVLTVGTKDGPITFPVPRKSKVKEYFWLQK